MDRVTFKLREWFSNQYRELDLLSDYSQALFRMWQALLWGGSILAVGWGLRFIVGEWPIWVNWAAVLVALFFSGYYVWRDDHIHLVPQLYVWEIWTHPISATETFGKPIGSGICLQVVPQSLTEAPIHDCQGYLLRVVRNVQNKRVRVARNDREREIDLDWEIEVNEPLLLKWSHTDQTSVTLYPGIDRRLNVVLIDWLGKKIVPYAHELPSCPGLTVSPGDHFRLDVKLICKDGAPFDLSLNVKLGNELDEPDVEVIPWGNRYRWDKYYERYVRR
jgi:hypothetical protein